MLTKFTPSSPSLRESIRYPATGERKYIRYFDGRGHFAHVCVQLLPRPGDLCSVSLDGACPLPHDACNAVRAALFRRFENGPRMRLPLIGMEARLIGGSYFAQYSYPAAAAAAACMAYDEALPRAAPMLVEPWIGVAVGLPWGALASRLQTLTRVLGEVRMVATSGDSVTLRIETPERLLPAVQAAARPATLELFPLPPQSRYRELAADAGPSQPSTYSLDEWT